MPESLPAGTRSHRPITYEATPTQHGCVQRAIPTVGSFTLGWNPGRYPHDDDTASLLIRYGQATGAPDEREPEEGWPNAPRIYRQVFCGTSVVEVDKLLAHEHGAWYPWWLRARRRNPDQRLMIAEGARRKAADILAVIAEDFLTRADAAELLTAHYRSQAARRAHTHRVNIRLAEIELAQWNELLAAEWSLLAQQEAIESGANPSGHPPTPLRKEHCTARTPSGRKFLMATAPTDLQADRAGRASRLVVRMAGEHSISVQREKRAGAAATFSSVNTTNEEDAMGTLKQAIGTWDKGDLRTAAAIVAALVMFQVLGLAALAAAGHATNVALWGIGLTAWTFGARHAFDADHIAAIDNTTRKLREDGHRPKTVGIWFSLGHSTVVALLALLVALGAKAAITWTDPNSQVRNTLEILGTSISGVFLLLIAGLNLTALRQLTRDRHQDGQNTPPGPLGRLLPNLTKGLTHPWQMYTVGFLFGLGFDTATEVALLVLSARTAAAGAPWWHVLALPVLFAAGMVLLDGIDGLVMSLAYEWAFADEHRRAGYNIVVTGISVVVAIVIGGIELLQVAREQLPQAARFTELVASVYLSNVGYLVTAVIVTVWVCAVGRVRATKPA